MWCLHYRLGTSWEWVRVCMGIMVGLGFGMRKGLACSWLLSWLAQLWSGKVCHVPDLPGRCGGRLGEMSHLGGHTLHVGRSDWLVWVQRIKVGLCLIKGS